MSEEYNRIIMKIVAKINDYHIKKGELIKDWAVHELEGNVSINGLLQYLESKNGSEPNINNAQTLKNLQKDITKDVNDIFKMCPKIKKGDLYNILINELNWEHPKSIKNTVLYQFLKNTRPKRDVKWNDIEIPYKESLNNKIRESEDGIASDIKKLYWGQLTKETLADYNIKENKEKFEKLYSKMKKNDKNDFEKFKQIELQIKKADEFLANQRITEENLKNGELTDDQKKAFEKEINAYEIFEDPKSSLPEDLIEFIKRNTRSEIGKFEDLEKIYPHDIAKLYYDWKELKAYEAFKQMIDNKKTIPHWILNSWDQSINLSNCYNSDEFKLLNLQDNSISDKNEKEAIKKLKESYESIFNYANWINIINDEVIVPNNDTTRIEPYGDKVLWDMIYDNIQFFNDYSTKGTSSPKDKILKKYTEEYLDVVISLASSLKLKKNCDGYLCTVLAQYLKNSVKTKDDKLGKEPIEFWRSIRNYNIMQILHYLFDYMLFPSKNAYDILEQKLEELDKELDNAEFEKKSDITESFKIAINKIDKKYSLKDIKKREEVHNHNSLVNDIANRLLNEFQTYKPDSYKPDSYKPDFYKPHLYEAYCFGGMLKNELDDRFSTWQDSFSETKIKNIFICLKEFPTVIKSRFKFSKLKASRYQYFEKLFSLYPGNYDKYFLNKAYTQRGGEDVYQIRDDYGLGGKHFDETRKHFRLPEPFVEQGESLSSLGDGCSQYLTNCENFVNYVAAMLYDPLLSEDKREERICELICCYPKVYEKVIKENEKRIKKLEKQKA